MRRPFDAIRGNGVHNPYVTLRRAANPNDFLSIALDRDSRVLIPSKEDILVEVSADGYRPMHIETQAGTTHANSINLRAGETKDLTIRLEPNAR